MSKNEIGLALVSGATTPTKQHSNSNLNTENSRPWVGSYFGIPEPEIAPIYKLNSYSTIECEIEILYKELTVKKYTISHNRNHRYINEDGVAHLGMFDPQDLSVSLKDIAWRNREAIAFVIYYTSTDSRTGKSKEIHPMCKCIRASKYTWRWVYDFQENGKPFMPSVVKEQYPHMAKAYEDKENNY